MSSAKKPSKSAGGCVASFVHWRSGKRIVASNYGYKGFPIGKRGKKK